MLWRLRKSEQRLVPFTFKQLSAVLNLALVLFEGSGKCFIQGEGIIVGLPPALVPTLSHDTLIVAAGKDGY